MSDADASLMLAFVAGREDAFVELYRRHRDRIVTFTSRMLGDQARAEEAAQEVFLKLYRARATYQAKSRFSTFLYRIATNHCLNLRALADQRLVDTSAEQDLLVSEDLDQHQGLAHKRLRLSLNRALGRLPERQRAALLLVHYEGLSYREAAESIDVSEPAVKSLIHRARAALMLELGSELEAVKEGEHAV